MTFIFPSLTVKAVVSLFLTSAYDSDAALEATARYRTTPSDGVRVP